MCKDYTSLEMASFIIGLRVLALKFSFIKNMAEQSSRNVDKMAQIIKRKGQKKKNWLRTIQQKDVGC